MSGCSVSPLFSNLGTVARLATTGIPDAPVTKEYIANLPYASIGAKIGRGQRSLLVLGRYDGEDRHWISADRAVVVTRNGRLMRVFGVGSDLRDTIRTEADPIAAATYAFEGMHVRSVDLGASMQFGVPIESTFDVKRRETIKILDQEHDVLLVSERNAARTLRWSFDNDFWLDFQTGYVWRSSQHFAPDRPPLEIEVYKPDM